jgi:bifunctional NMN adenylyltransferase/nudix hydrolase
MNEISLSVPPLLDVSEFEIGVIICRMQVHILTPAHIALLNKVCENHKKVIICLGVPKIPDDRNPLDFATRKIMIQNYYPNVMIIPINDCRYNKDWSNNLDKQISLVFGDRKTLLYGSRDSFISYYSGKHQVIELISNVNYSGTEVRKEVRREILETSDYRAGVITGKADRYPTAYNTVDVACINNSGEVLLARKPDEDKFRFIGGFIDPKDESKEASASREFGEETGGCEIGDLKYVCSQKIDDWRYRRSKDSIMTTLFVGKFIFGSPTPTDDVCELKWYDIIELDTKNNNGSLADIIMEEHLELMNSFLNNK